MRKFSRKYNNCLLFKKIIFFEDCRHHRFSFLLCRKRLLSDQNDDCDLDNTRDSVLSGNSQGDNCDPELMIIDFEYCAYNYRGFDLANHFLEWTMDYTNTEFPFFHHRKTAYPTMEQQQRFITTYLIELASCDDYVPTKAEIDEIKEEVRCFTLASHLFWTLWSLVNVQQEIEFGYWVRF